MRMRQYIIYCPPFHFFNDQPFYIRDLMCVCLSGCDEDRAGRGGVRLQQERPGEVLQQSEPEPKGDKVVAIPTDGAGDEA